MNVKLGVEERRRYVLEAVSKELEVCVVIDSGLSKAGNEAMEQEVERAGLKWVGKGREGDRRRVGGVGFICKKVCEVEKLGWVGDTGGWVRIRRGSDSVVVGGIYRAPSMDVGETLREIRERVVGFGEEMVLVVGDFNCRIGELSNRVVGEGDEQEVVEYKRESEDKVVTREGREFIEAVNGVGMVVVNDGRASRVYEPSTRG